MPRIIKLKKNLPRKHYVADAVIVWCFDCRFKNGLKALENEFKLKNTDLIIVAGGAKNISNPEKPTDKDFILDQIEKSIKLHHAKKIFLMAHDNCGAYGNTSKEKVLEDLLRAKKIVSKSFQIPIESIFVDFKNINFVE